MTDRSPGVSAPPLSIVIPAFREEARLPASLEGIAAYLAGEPGLKGTELIVVDDGSPDETAAVAAEVGGRTGLDVHVIRLGENRGKGCAVRTGVLAASGARILVCDADLSTPVAEWRKLADAGAPIAIGSRAVDESTVRVRQPFYRQAVGRLFNKLVRLLAVPGIRDTQCGFKLFSREAALAIFPLCRVDRFAWDVEALGIARVLGIPVAEIPVLWFNSPDTRVTLAGGAQAYADLVRIGIRLLLMRRRGEGGSPTRAPRR